MNFKKIYILSNFFSPILSFESPKAKKSIKIWRKIMSKQKIILKKFKCLIKFLLNKPIGFNQKIKYYKNDDFIHLYFTCSAYFRLHTFIPKDRHLKKRLPKILSTKNVLLKSCALLNVFDSRRVFFITFLRSLKNKKSYKLFSFTAFL